MMLFNQQQQQADESMSNLTTASGEASGSSGGNKPPEFPYNFTSPSLQQQQPQIPQQPPNKKKRNLPGNPDPEAEVVALSPKTLMATNRFVCEVCKKGFQRDQNLQLHRRGHNLPWKLKQRPGGKDAPPPRKKVYVCPEVGCVHHDPARALGDLTGIKKHFSRKHGDKRWKCDKCSKRYAVHSDFKAHSKTCGTREYRCDCGTIFSRRDSFITHRAFCDALAEESARAIVTNHGNAAVVPMPVQSAIHRHHFNQLLNNNNNNNNSNNNNMQMLVDHHHHHHHQANNANNSMSSSSSSVLMMKKEEQQQQQQNGFGSSSSSSNSHLLIPPWLAGPNHPPSHFDHHHQSNNNNVNSNSNQHLFSSLQDFSAEEHDFSPNPNPNPNRLPPFQPPVMSAHMSATALLQKAAQIGATMSSDEPPSISSPAPRADGINDHVLFPAKKHREISAGVSTGNNNGVDHHNHHQAGLTRDFLGLRALSHSDILSLAGLGNTINISHQEHQNNQQTLHKPW